MITDTVTNVVYISDLLEPRYPELVESLRAILSDHEIPVKVIQGTREIWCRDYMPVQLGMGEFVQFHYKPDYLKGYEQWRTSPSDIEPLPEVERCATSEIVLDGGNVVGWGNCCIVTDKVVRENPGIGRGELLGMLRDLLRVEDLIMIPSEPYDVLGHADGVVRFLDEEIVVINDYAEIAPAYRERLVTILRRARLSWTEVPYRPRHGWRGEIPPAFGTYVNFLRVGGLVVLPGYGLPEDDLARQVLADRLPATEIVTLDCTELSMEGGALNCITWNIAT